MIFDRPLHILVFPGGTENGLEIYKSLRHLKEVKLFSVSDATPNHASCVYSHHTVIPSVTDPEWVPALNRVIETYQIDYLFPANSKLMAALVACRADISCEILMSDNDVIETTGSKKATFLALKEEIPLPEVVEDQFQQASYPLFIKPDKGYGSQGALQVNSYEQLVEETQSQFDQFMIQEVLPGDEITVDCFSSQSGELIHCQGRYRQRIRMGTSMRSQVVSDMFNRLLTQYATSILKKIALRGPWFFQMKQNGEGEWKLLEVDARVSGTMALNRVCGINIPLLTILDSKGQSVKTLPLLSRRVTIDRSLRNRYEHDITYEYVYIDLDDTIVVHDQLNLQVMAFIYQCINRSIPVYLLTKHIGPNLSEYLKKYRIDQCFDQVIHIKESENKADYIREPTSIFIDDSFSQRATVQQTLGIPTFDSTMVEVLIDDRL